MSDDPQTWREHIHSDPEIMGGRPVVRGSRVTVEFILELLADDPDSRKAAAELRNVDGADVLAAIAFAAYMLRAEPDVARRFASAADA